MFSQTTSDMIFLQVETWPDCWVTLENSKFHLSEQSKQVENKVECIFNVFYGTALPACILLLWEPFLSVFIWVIFHLFSKCSDLYKSGPIGSLIWMFSHQKVASVKRITRIRRCGLVGVGVVLLKDMCHCGWALRFQKVQIRSSIFSSLSFSLWIRVLQCTSACVLQCSLT